MTAASRRALDDLRRRPMLDRKHQMLAYELDGHQQAAHHAMEDRLDDEIGDERLVWRLRPVIPCCPARLG